MADEHCPFCGGPGVTTNIGFGDEVQCGAPYNDCPMTKHKIPKDKWNTRHASAAIPPDMVLVPREPTEAMVDAGVNAPNDQWARDACKYSYKAMIGAIPEGEK